MNGYKNGQIHLGERGPHGPRSPAGLQRRVIPEEPPTERGPTSPIRPTCFPSAPGAVIIFWGLPLLGAKPGKVAGTLRRAVRFHRQNAHPFVRRACTWKRKSHFLAPIKVPSGLPSCLANHRTFPSTGQHPLLLPAPTRLARRRPRRPPAPLGFARFQHWQDSSSCSLPRSCSPTTCDP